MKIKKVVIILLIIILLFSIILIYKITSSTNEDIDVADTDNYQEEIYDIYTQNNITELENQTIAKEQASSNNKDIQPEVSTKPTQEVKQYTKTEENASQVPEKNQQHTQNSTSSKNN